MGEWTPVFKKGEKEAKENYRPITVLPTISPSIAWQSVRASFV